MAEKIFIAVAWPYANGPLHTGQIVSSQLPADILARYHRARGDRVLMVSGSDQHGTPITVRAEQEGRTPQEVASRYHEEFLETWRLLGITWDLYTTTGTENHARVTHDIFLRLLEKGYIYKDSMALPYCLRDAPLPARPLRRGHLPPLRLRRRPGRPVRQLRQDPRPAGAHRAALQALR